MTETIPIAIVVVFSAAVIYFNIRVFCWPEIKDKPSMGAGERRRIHDVLDKGGFEALAAYAKCTRRRP